MTLVGWCRLHVLPEPVDVDFFNPAGVAPLRLPMGQLVFGQSRKEPGTVAFVSVSHNVPPSCVFV